MCKKLFVTAIVCMGLITMMGTEEAKGVGWPLPTAFTWVPGSIYCNSDWKSIGNTDQYDSVIECVIDITGIQAECANNGDNTGGLGNPFDVDVIVSGLQLLTADNLEGKGKASSSILMETQFLFDAVFCVKDETGECVIAEDENGDDICLITDPDTGDCIYYKYVYDFPEGICQNDNWYVIQPIDGGTFLVTDGDVQLNAYVDGVLKTFLLGSCSYNPDTEMYDCVTDEVVKIK